MINSSADRFRCVVRVQSEAFQRGNTYFYGKSVRVLRRLTNYDIIEDEVGQIGMREALEQIVNLDVCPDGVYEVVINSRSYDIESGYLDDWDWKLIPYVEE